MNDNNAVWEVKWQQLEKVVLELSFEGDVRISSAKGHFEKKEVVAEKRRHNNPPQ